MKEITLPSGKYLLVEIPIEDCDLIEINNSGTDICFWDESGSSEASLPTGQWSIVGKASELTKEQWKGIMPTIESWSIPLYYNYTSNDRDFRDIVDSAFKEAIESARTLITHNGFKFETTLILKSEINA